MNERMIELARQSGLKKHPSEDREYIGDFDWREFAELIIRECVDVASKYDAPKMSGPGLMIGHMIEQHFGVEN